MVPPTLPKSEDGDEVDIEGMCGSAVGCVGGADRPLNRVGSGIGVRVTIMAIARAGCG